MKQILLMIAGIALVGCGTTAAMLIHKAAFDGNIKAVKRHLDAGVDANAQTRSENTPLHATAYRRLTGGIPRLLSCLLPMERMSM